MQTAPVIVLFRRDLRIGDNAALGAAARTGAPLIPLYILDESDPFAPGGASRWWLHHSLEALARQLKGLGGALVLRKGPSPATLLELAREVGATAVFWNRRYAQPQIAADTALKSDLEAAGVIVKSFPGFLLREPWEVTTAQGGAFRVYTPFRRKVREMGPGGALVESPGRIVSGPFVSTEPLHSWALTPSDPDWAAEFDKAWTPGEAGAAQALSSFLARAQGYDKDRERPGTEGTSRLSPHLAFGEIAPARVWRCLQNAVEAEEIAAQAGEVFLAELLWREFSWHILHHHPQMRHKPLRPQFENIPWRHDPSAFQAWRHGRTGYPIVDAGMRQLWRTGWMHNRVRMITASFLVKDLLIPWQEGEAWFWDTLVDADPANNAAGWQWVTGSGIDAAPFFRIFNPTTQGEKFDPDGGYVRNFVPELSTLPDAWLHKPWSAPQSALSAAGIELERDYPLPVVDHAHARKRALNAYESTRNRGVEHGAAF